MKNTENVIYSMGINKTQCNFLVTIWKYYQLGERWRKEREDETKIKESGKRQKNLTKTGYRRLKLDNKHGQTVKSVSDECQ